MMVHLRLKKSVEWFCTDLRSHESAISRYLRESATTQDVKEGGLVELVAGFESTAHVRTRVPLAVPWKRAHRRCNAVPARPLVATAGNR